MFENLIVYNLSRVLIMVICEVSCQRIHFPVVALSASVVCRHLYHIPDAFLKLIKTGRANSSLPVFIQKSILLMNNDRTSLIDLISRWCLYHGSSNICYANM